MLLHRTLSGIVLISALVIVVFYAHGWSTVFVPLGVSLIAVTGLLEFYYLMEQKGYTPLRLWGIIFSILYLFVVYAVSLFRVLQIEDLVLMPIYLAILSAALIITFRGKTHTALSTFASSLAGFLFVTWLLAFVLRIILWRSAVDLDGRYFFFFFIVTVKSTDIAAYFIGTHFGRHKLAPGLSPNKSIEGSVAGLIVSMIVAAILVHVMPSVSLMYARAAERIVGAHSSLMIYVLGAMTGMLLSTLGQLGDLAESLWKRDAGVKDSGGYIPGMGGVLDVTDSLLYTAAPMYIIMKLLEAC